MNTPSRSSGRIAQVHKAASTWISRDSAGKDYGDPTNVERAPTLDNLDGASMDVSGIAERYIDEFIDYVEDAAHVALGRPRPLDHGMTAWRIWFEDTTQPSEEKES